MMRGSVVVVALPGDVGKPRPAIVLRSSRFMFHTRISVVPCTSQLQPWRTLRVDLAPSDANGLRIPCQAMIDRVTSVQEERARQIIGWLADADMAAIDRAVLVYFGFAE
jgi:mRNA interferase MazF